MQLTNFLLLAVTGLATANALSAEDSYQNL